MLTIASISIAFLLALILFTKKGRTMADRILSAWIAIMGTHLAFYYASVTADPYYYPYLLIGYPFPLLHGPMLYLYTASITDQHLYLRKRWWLHFLPAMLMYALIIPFFVLTHQERLDIFSNRGAGYEWFFALHKILVLTSGVLYVAISLWLLRNHTDRLKEKFSHTERVNLAWLRYLIYSTGLVWLAVFSGNNLVIFSLVAIFVLVLAYFGIKQVGIFTQAETNKNGDEFEAAPISSKHDSAADQSKYRKSNLSANAQQEIHRKLTAAMDGQQLFLNPELTLAQLAECLGVHPNHLSQVINSLESKTFYDYINTKRVDEFKKRVSLPENQKYTLLALALECGFNSKTAFYRNFRNVTGQSPTQFLKDQRIQMATE